MSQLLQTSLGVQLLTTFAPKACICIFSENNIFQAKYLRIWKKVNMSRVKSCSHLTPFSQPIPDTGPCCSSYESFLHMRATHHRLIIGSQEPKDVVFLISLETADRCRKYGVTLLRRLLLCAICSLYPGQKGVQYIQLREALMLCMLSCAHGASASERPPTLPCPKLLPHQEHQLCHSEEAPVEQE